MYFWSKKNKKIHSYETEGEELFTRPKAEHVPSLWKSVQAEVAVPWTFETKSIIWPMALQKRSGRKNRPKQIMWPIKMHSFLYISQLVQVTLWMGLDWAET